MDDQTLNSIIKEKHEKTSKVPSPNKELFNKLHQTEMQYDMGALYNQLQKTHESLCALYAAENRYDEMLDAWLRISYDILHNNIFPLRAYNGKLYSQYGTHCKKNIVKTVAKNFNKNLAYTFEEFFDSLYEYIDFFKDLKDCSLYLWVLRDEDPDTYEKLSGLNSLNSVYSIYGDIYRVINDDAVICYNNDLYELNVDTLKMLLSSKSKSDDTLGKYVKCLKKEIKQSCVNHPIKDSENNRPLFKYLYPKNTQYILRSDQGKISFSNQFATAFFKPIKAEAADLEKIRNDYVPQAFCKSLQVISNNNYTIIKEFAKLLADCLLPYPLSQKLYVINAKDEHDVNIIKKFIKRILSYGNGSNGSICVIDKDQSINDVCKAYEDYDKLKYTRIYALFMKRDKNKLNQQLNVYLSNLLKKTSSNSKNSFANNIQPILFQTTGDISDISSNCVEYIDISNSGLDERINALSSEDCCWTRLFFSLYGLHLILEKQKSKLDFDLGCKLEVSKTNSSDVTAFYESKEEYIERITSDFVERYFTASENDLMAIKQQRKQKIDEIKKQNKGAENIEDILTKELADTPLHVTFESKLKIYIQTYIDTQCKASLLKQYKISADDVYNLIRRRYKFKPTNVLYTGEKTRYAIIQFGLKEPWPITKAKMEQTNVNTIEEPDVEPIEAPKTACFDDPIDENLLDFLKKLNNTVNF